jgi:hypothetical protein
LAADLRKCQIDPWLDTEEIRDGRPWLTVIFEDGIPSCDAVIIYLTENSLASKMVAKELDATLVEQLSESGISLFPYVAKAELRGKLRSDIRGLQCREWNPSNYSELLPSVVAEVWRSFMERHTTTAMLQERNMRLELELRLKELNERFVDSVFTAQEEREFQYLLRMLERPIEVKLHIVDTINPAPYQRFFRDADVFRLPLIGAAVNYVNEGAQNFFQDRFSSTVKQIIEKSGHVKVSQEGVSIANVRITNDVLLEFLTYGLVDKLPIVESGEFQNFSYPFTPKMFRFRYWLSFKNISLEEIPVEYKGTIKEH